ncbi:hypothetical protein ACQY0O_003693 [Thecaphora frezii]
MRLRACTCRTLDGLSVSPFARCFPLYHAGFPLPCRFPSPLSVSPSPLSLPLLIFVRNLGAPPSTVHARRLLSCLARLPWPMMGPRRPTTRRSPLRFDLRPAPPANHRPPMRFVSPPPRPRHPRHRRRFPLLAHRCCSIHQLSQTSLDPKGGSAAIAPKC